MTSAITARTHCVSEVIGPFTSHDRPRIGPSTEPQVVMRTLISRRTGEKPQRCTKEPYRPSCQACVACICSSHVPSGPFTCRRNSWVLHPQNMQALTRYLRKMQKPRGKVTLKGKYMDHYHYKSGAYERGASAH